MRKMRELDAVVLAHDIDEYGLRQGDVGAVVHRYTVEGAFEVEFVTAAERTIALLTLDVADIRPAAEQEMLHVRKVSLGPVFRGFLRARSGESLTRSTKTPSPSLGNLVTSSKRLASLNQTCWALQGAKRVFSNGSRELICANDWSCG